MFRGLDQRVQKFYNNVAAMVSKINSKRSTIKTEVYRTEAPERYQALLHKVLINYKVLQKVVKKTNFMKNIPLGVVIAYEILSKKIKNDGYLRKLKGALGKEKLKVAKTRCFVRINTLKATESDLAGYITVKTCIPNVYEIFDEPPQEEEIDQGSEVESYENLDYEEESTTDLENNSNEQEYESEEVNDIDINEVDINEADNSKVQKISYKKIKDLFKYNLVPEKIKIQNFSSCLPAFVLNPEPNSTVIDATASPGNKTTHLCSIMNNTGKIYAFERNKTRYDTLVEQVKKYGSNNIETIHADFLRADPEKYKADYVIVDPSCSGSGIHLNYEKNDKRLGKLKNFQAMMLNHAFKFGPKAVVYSVCSKHHEEGEDVVKEALEKNPTYELETIGYHTKHRGHTGFDFSEKVIRTSDEDEDGSIGFFVALFKRKSEN
ncbi:putative 28S rRNA (cytosine-C(5))-methyltransferase [Glugoides intestinalis]